MHFKMHFGVYFETYSEMQFKRYFSKHFGRLDGWKKTLGKSTEPLELTYFLVPEHRTPIWVGFKVRLH